MAIYIEGESFFDLEAPQRCEKKVFLIKKTEREIYPTFPVV